MIWSFVLAAVGIAGIYLAGRKSKWGWGLGLAAQVLWVVFAITTAQYGFILTAVAYGAVYGKNLWQWHREDSYKEDPAWVIPNGGDGIRPSGTITVNGTEHDVADLWYRSKSTLENCYDAPPGNDGLTAAERKEYADRYAAGPGRGLDDKGRETLRRFRERRNDQSKRDQPTGE